MKRILTLAAVCLFVFQLNAQTLPQGIAYQAVAVKEGPYSLAGQNAPTIYWSNKDIQVRFTILDKYPSGTSQYSEVHATTTDGFGVFNLIIGQGDVLSGDFTKIPWELGTAHLQVEIDFDNDGSFKLTSLEKFWSVPYAFTTRKSSSTSTDSSLNALNNKYNYLRNRDKDTVIGNEGGVSYASLDSLNQVLLAKLARLDSLNALDKDTVIGNELQNLSLNGDSLFISEGNVVKINHPINLDNDSTNEIQTISLNNDTISLSNGGGKVALQELRPYLESIDIGSYGIDTAYTFSVSASSGISNANPPTQITQISVLAGRWVRIEGSMQRQGNRGTGGADIILEVISGSIANYVNSGLKIGVNSYVASQTSSGVIYFRAINNSIINVKFKVTGGKINVSGGSSGLISF